MKKIISILTISLLLSLSIKWDCIQGKSLTVNERIISVFKLAKSEIISSSINVWGEYKKDLDITQMENMARSVADSMNLDIKSVQVSKDCSDSLKQVLLKGKDDMESIITVKLESLLEEDDKSENYLSIDVYHDGEFDMDIMSNRIKQVYTRYESTSHINTCVIGIFDGKSIDRQAKIGKELVNANFTIKYNPEDNKTYMWLATPIITDGY